MNEEHQAHVVLRDGMHFEGFAGDEFAIQLDASPEVGGQGKGSRPAKLVLVSLAGCSAMDVLSIMRKKRQQVSGLEVRVRAERADEHPRVYTHIWLTFIETGQDISPKAVERSVELSMTSYCPVAAMLHRAVPIETDYEIIEA